VICVDGPTASGKGTLAAALAQRLGYHFLDSGALYRITALAATRAGLALDAGRASHCRPGPPLPSALSGTRSAGRRRRQRRHPHRRSRHERLARVGLPAVRTALIDLQHGFRRLPGLVADGRDMGTGDLSARALKVF
jgi:3-phosphoshikimate 1-carboxyvinyltransferase